MTKAIYTFTLILTMFFLHTSCGTAKKTSAGNNVSNYTVKFVPNSQNMYEGNLIVQVLDSKGQELTGATLFLYSEGKQISELDLNTTSMGVFFKEQKNLTVKATKLGYVDSNTEVITMTPENACFLEIRLVAQ